MAASKTATLTPQNVTASAVTVATPLSFFLLYTGYNNSINISIYLIKHRHRLQGKMSEEFLLLSYTAAPQIIQPLML